MISGAETVFCPVPFSRFEVSGSINFVGRDDGPSAPNSLLVQMRSEDGLWTLCSNVCQGKKNDSYEIQRLDVVVVTIVFVPRLQVFAHVWTYICQLLTKVQ
jgi:hypothetical protein